jgi:hypothetical protein
MGGECGEDEVGVELKIWLAGEEGAEETLESILVVERQAEELALLAGRACELVQQT